MSTIGLKIEGSLAESDLRISISFPLHHDGGETVDSDKIFKYKVARK